MCIFFAIINIKPDSNRIRKDTTMKKTVFEGIATALITPLDANGINYTQFGALIDWQIEQGIDALVICGTTGENATLHDSEHKAAIEFAVKRAAGRIPIIAGTGSNDVAHAVMMTEFASSVGADAVLTVTPYYNKCTQNGLVQSFTTIADHSAVPVILYNVPSRTGVQILPKTYEILADHPNIVAFKEANGDISKIAETMALVGDKLTLYSGNDDQIVPLLSLGGKGCISVLSNVLPAQTREICTRFFNGDVAGSCELQLRYQKLIAALFSEVNPIPVKAAMAAMGFCENYLRLPLTPMEEANYQNLLRRMREQGVRV